MTVIVEDFAESEQTRPLLDRAMAWLFVGPTILLLLSIPFYFLYRSTRLQAQRQYEADSARAPSAPPLAAEPAVGA